VLEGSSSNRISSDFKHLYECCLGQRLKAHILIKHTVQPAAKKSRSPTTYVQQLLLLLKAAGAIAVYAVDVAMLPLQICWLLPEVGQSYFKK
jgi:hypothetical protein